MTIQKKGALWLLGEVFETDEEGKLRRKIRMSPYGLSNGEIDDVLLIAMAQMFADDLADDVDGEMPTEETWVAETAKRLQYWLDHIIRDNSRMKLNLALLPGGKGPPK